MVHEPDADRMAGAQEGEVAQAGEASAEAKAAAAEEVVLNAAVAFAGQVVAAAQQAVQKADVPEALQGLMLRQYYLETAALCLRRLAEAYEGAAANPAQPALRDLLADGARRANEASAAVEALGDLSLDLLDRLL